MVGKAIAQYRVVEKLGSGGMGYVYRLRIRSSGDLLRSNSFLASLHWALRPGSGSHEAQAASALDHPNVGTIFQILESDGRSFIVMACYDGGSLKERIARGPMA